MGYNRCMDIQQLVDTAEETAKFRGHMLGHWDINCIGSRGDNSCQVCGAWVQVNTKPRPNDTNIGGSAVATNCKGE
jgi:hypothetical protein